MAEFKEITTQAEFDAAVKERLERERAKYADYEDLKKRAAEADSIQKKLEAAEADISKLKSDAKSNEEKLNNHDKEVSELSARAQKAEQSLLRLKIADEIGLPATLAERLAGNTEAELRKDAETLSQFINKNPAPLHSSEPGGNSAELQKNKSFQSMLNQLSNNF